MRESSDPGDGLVDLDNMRQMRDLLGEANLAELLAMLLGDLVDGPATIAQAAKDGDWRALARRCHTLQGSARSVGSRALIDHLLAIEVAADRQCVDHDAIAAMQADARRLCEAVLAWQAGPAA